MILKSSDTDGYRWTYFERKNKEFKFFNYFTLVPESLSAPVINFESKSSFLPQSGNSRSWEFSSDVGWPENKKKFQFSELYPSLAII